MTTNRRSYVYVGLAGETAPGRPVKSGLYRMAAGDDRWELATRGLPDAPAIRAIATHPERPETISSEPRTDRTAATITAITGRSSTFLATACPSGRWHSIRETRR